VRANVTTWSLQTSDAAALRPASTPPGPIELRRAIRPSPELGRFLYTAAGGNWYWTDRLPWSYDQWLQRLSQPRVETWVLYEEGTPAGYFELDGGTEGDVEIAYLGVLPAFIGRRLGGWLLSEAIRRGWEMGCGRVWVHTCSLDSPAALANYQARGMSIFKEQTEVVDLPDATPGSWPGAGVHGPGTSVTRITGG
jgi:GNAT superfamily N-acetyltransferase